MKLCPNCREVYADDKLNFCRNDGTALVQYSDEDETASLPGPLVGPDLAACGLRGTEIVPSAAVLGLLAKRDDHLIEPSKLVPIYLREVAFIKAPPARILPK